MKILIYGGGAVGLGIASCLIKTGNKVDIIARKNTCTQLQKKGLIRTGIFGDIIASSPSFSCFKSIHEIGGNKYDFILIATKSYSSVDVAEDLFMYYTKPENTIIVLMQNGWGNNEIFLKKYDKSIIYNARIITGFYRHEKNHVEITAHSEAIHIGSLYGKNNEKTEKLANAINAGDIPCKTTENIDKDIWAKMLFNCTLNPLGAIFNVSYGELGESENMRTIINMIAHEIFEILKKTTYQTWWHTSDSYLSEFYTKILPKVQKHKSSMLQDIRDKKPTEIDALNGSIIKLGQKYQLKTNVNEIVFNMVRYIENSYLKPQKKMA